MPPFGNASDSFVDRIDSQFLSIEELADALNDLLCSEGLRQADSSLITLVALLDRVNKVNPHQHITGSVGDRPLLRQVIQVYREDASAKEAFLDYAVDQGLARRKKLTALVEQPDEGLLDWVEGRIPLPGVPRNFGEADDRLTLTRLAFQSKHPSALELLRQAYRTVALENSAHGVTHVWFRTSMGDHQDGSFEPAARAALDGARMAEEDAEVPLTVGYLVGIRKYSPNSSTQPSPAYSTDIRSEGLVAAIQRVRQDVPNAEKMIIGIDSVGMDSDWLPEWQAAARGIAAAAQMRIAVHFGESWQEGNLLLRLKVLEDLARFGSIHQLDNANALFAVRDLLSSHQVYSTHDWAQIRRVQHTVLEILAERGIVLGINPTSNDLLTRSLRQREGWRFRGLDEPLGVGMASMLDLMGPGIFHGEPLVVVVGNDNSRLYPSRIAGCFLTVSEELANLWDAPGSTEFSIYGKYSTKVIARLISNGFNLVRQNQARQLIEVGQYLAR